jgi:hypothetical protein
MQTKAVIDRFEEDKAVLLLWDEDKQIVVNRKSLPKMVKEGTWLLVDIEGDQVLSATIDEEETARARQRIMEKLERLRKGEHLQ